MFVCMSVCICTYVCVCVYVCMQRQEHRTMFKNQSDNITKNKELKEQTSLILVVG